MLIRAKKGGNLPPKDSACAYLLVKRCILKNPYIGLARTIYIRLIYGIFGREITKYTVIYGVYIRFWPTLPL
jgi:hypothetical protein